MDESVEYFGYFAKEFVNFLVKFLAFLLHFLDRLPGGCWLT